MTLDTQVTGPRRFGSMMIRLIAAVTLLVTGALVVIPARAQSHKGFEPSGYKSWRHATDPHRHAALFGGAIQNYPDDDNWYIIDNDFAVSGSNYEAQNAALKTTVTPDGVVTVDLTVNGITYTVEQELIRVVWLNTATKNWVDIADVSWGTPSVDSNIVRWTNVIPGVNYQVIKQNGKVDNRIVFRDAFLDFAVTLFDQRADSADIALANVFRYRLVNIDDPDALPDNITWRRLKNWGKLAFDLTRQQLQVGTRDLLETPWVRQRWVRQNNNLYCVEYVKMGEVKVLHEAYPDEPIWHNASETFDYEDCEDAFVYSSQPTYNYGITARIYGGDSTGTSFVTMMRFDLSSIPSNATVDSAYLGMCRNTTTSGDSVEIGHMVTDDWVEGTEDGAAPDEMGENGCTWEMANEGYGAIFDIEWADGDVSTDDWDFSAGGVYGMIKFANTLVGSYKSGAIFGGISSQLVAQIQDWVEGSEDNGGWTIWDYDGSGSGGIVSADDLLNPGLLAPSMYVEWTEPEIESARRRRLLPEDN